MNYLLHPHHCRLEHGSPGDLSGRSRWPGAVALPLDAVWREEIMSRALVSKPTHSLGPKWSCIRTVQTSNPRFPQKPFLLESSSEIQRGPQNRQPRPTLSAPSCLRSLHICGSPSLPPCSSPGSAWHELRGAHAPTQHPPFLATASWSCCLEQRKGGYRPRGPQPSLPAVTPVFRDN